MTLGLPVGATASEIAQAIRESDTYSFTPYRDNNAEGTITASTDYEALTPTDEILLNIAEYAESMDSSNCNVAFMVGTIASRGQDGEAFVNGVTGFNENGDGVLSQAESHQWGVNNRGQIIDGTPGGGATDAPEPESYEATSTSDSGTLELTIKLVAALLALSSAAYAGRRITPPALAAVQRQRSETATNWLSAEERAPELTQDMANLKHLLYARPGASLPQGARSTDQRPIGEQLRGLPQLTRKDVNRLVASRVASGTDIPSDARRRLRQLTTKARTARSFTPKTRK